MNSILLVGFFVLSYVLGIMIFRFFWKKNTDALFVLVASGMLGFFISTWMIYVAASVMHSMFWGIVDGEVVIGIIVLCNVLKSKHEYQKLHISKGEIGVLTFALLFSLWTIWKTFKVGSDSAFLIGSNLVFDMGHAISVVRSFSYGNNVPYMSPFVAGLPHVYHFMFYFWCGVLEYLGLPLVSAINIPSILSFSALLIVVYYLPIYVFGGSVWAGLLSVVLSITHSTATWLYFLFDPSKNKHLFSSIWNNANYYFAGPYDGSLISIFWTLNVMVNQRHLAFSIAIILILFLVVSNAFQKEKTLTLPKVALLGFLIGLLPWWHMTLWLGGIIVFGLLFIVKKQWNNTVVFCLISGLVGFIQLAPWIVSSRVTDLTGVSSGRFSWFLSSSIFGYVWYWIQNAGWLLITVVLGYSILPRKTRWIVIPFFILFAVANFIRITANMPENHKFINLIIFIFNALSSYGLTQIWNKRLSGKLFVVVSIIFLTFSGVIDLMVIKNDFQYPVSDAPKSTLMQFVKTNTKPGSVFLSYQDMFDPITMSGRKAYCAFFEGAEYASHVQIMKRIYEAQNTDDVLLLREHAIDYIVVPKWKKDDFPYSVNLQLFRDNLHTVFEDNRHVVFAVN